MVISRARATVQYPARFQLIAAQNPCPCGHFQDPEKACTCTPAERTRYLSRLSGPLLDRVDLVCRVPRLTVDELTRAPEPEPSAPVTTHNKCELHKLNANDPSQRRVAA